MTLRLLLADDEPPLLDWLSRLVAQVAPDAAVVATAGDGDSALALIEQLRPDAALLDIRMPGLSGLDVAARLTVPCRVAFVTAYDEFAVQAFDQAAVDYLLKPVAPERLARTIDRLRAAVPTPAPELLRQLLARLEPAPSAPPPRFLRWLRLGDEAAVQLLDVAEVDRFEAADKYTLVHAGERQWLIRTALSELEAQLDPDAFWRIHRGSLVRVAAIREVRRDLMGRLWAEFHSGARPAPVSRSHAHRFRQM